MLWLFFERYARDELRVVVFGPRQEAPLAPFEEAPEGEFGVAADVDLIPVRPDIQTHQHDANAHRPIQLAESEHSRADSAIYVGGMEIIYGVNICRKKIFRQAVREREIVSFSS